MRLLMLGKGGCGKTTLSILICRELVRRGLRPLLLDVDERSRGVAKLLGVAEPAWLVDAMGGPEGIYRLVNLGVRRILSLRDCLVKSRDGVFLAQAGKLMVGGEGCACAIHASAISFLKSIEEGSKGFIVIDTGSSIEFLGRGVDGGLIDAALFVATGSCDEVELAVRMERMCVEVGVPNFFVVLNKVRVDSRGQADRLRELGFHVKGLVRHDPLVRWAWLKGQPLKAGVSALDVKDLCDNLLSSLHIAVEEAS
ncbi:MAG: hypothetical protein DRJ97_01920 [Thermoprotei archaeon]|nr:MAG: hypothetical protein DRJ97_01920 [Thermoprotei archaeon]